MATPTLKAERDAVDKAVLAILTRRCATVDTIERLIGAPKGSGVVAASVRRLRARRLVRRVLGARPNFWGNTPGIYEAVHFGR